MTIQTFAGMDEHGAKDLRVMNKAEEDNNIAMCKTCPRGERISIHH